MIGHKFFKNAAHEEDHGIGLKAPGVSDIKMNHHLIALLLLLSPLISLCFSSSAKNDVSLHSSPTKATTTQLKMCQLMGMNCAALTDFTFSFRGFARRGGDTDVHSHGWGLCFYD
eukprot:scaffold20459_cov145-Skeletonema_marinoi.AAC.3